MDLAILHQNGRADIDRLFLDCATYAETLDGTADLNIIDTTAVFSLYDTHLHMTRFDLASCVGGQRIAARAAVRAFSAINGGRGLGETLFARNTMTVSTHI